MTVRLRKSASQRRLAILRHRCALKRRLRQSKPTKLELHTPERPVASQRDPVEVPVPEGELEAHREIVGLRLAGAPIRIDGDKATGVTLKCGTWEYPVMDEQRRCFAGVLREAVDKSMRAKFWRMVHSGTPWEQPMQTWGPMPRKTAWMCEAPCSCKYGYGGMQIAPIPFPAWMYEIMDLLMPLCGLRSRVEWPNSCNLNLYEDGGHSVSWHSDNEKLFNGKFQDCPIISLSLGQERCFELKGGDIKKPMKLQLRDGDLCTMEGMFQKYYDHRVPREDKKIGPRINITWRWVVEHFSTCGLCTAERRIMPFGGGKANSNANKGKGKGKGHDKGKGKGKGKDDKGKGKGKGKGKDNGKSKANGKHSGSGMFKPQATIQKH